jgi:hypothetical protein
MSASAFHRRFREPPPRASFPQKDLSTTCTLTDPDGLGFLRTNMGPVYTRDTHIASGRLMK